MPDFSQDAQNAGFGQYGRRPWYEYMVFPSSKGPTKEMSYQSVSSCVLLCYDLTAHADHNDRIKLLQRATGVVITKGTHGGREYGALEARLHGASVEDTKAMGIWNESGSFRTCYDRTHPTAAYLGAASFPANQPEAYSVTRTGLGACYYYSAPLTLILLRTTGRARNHAAPVD